MGNEGHTPDSAAFPNRTAIKTPVVETGGTSWTDRPLAAGLFWTWGISSDLDTAFSVHPLGWIGPSRAQNPSREFLVTASDVQAITR
jgi:hypothetical protein